MSKVQVTEVTKKGDWYHVKGGIGDKRGSYEIPASSVEGRSRGDAQRMFERGIITSVVTSKE